MARCPVEEHEDNSPSLSVDLAEDGGSLLLYCFGYCEVGVVLDALGLSMRDLFLRTTAKPRPPRQNRQLAKWERVAERAMQQQWLEAQPWYWTYRAALFDWANCPEDARLCEVHADLLGGGR